jgi:MFS transporter, AAHS family, benzoate transport protein
VTTENAMAIRVTRTPAMIMFLSVVTLLFEGYDINIYGAVVPYLLKRADWHLTPQFTGLIGSAAVIGMLVGSLVAGPLTDLVGRRRVYLTTVVCFSVGSALSAVASSPELLLASRIVVGLGLGGFIPVSLAMVLEYSPAARRTFATAMASAGIGVGGGLAALATIWIAPATGYQGLFWLGVAPLVLIVPFALFRVPESVSLLLSLGKTEHARAQIRRYRLPIELPEPAASNGAWVNPSSSGPGSARRLLVALRSLFAPGQGGATVVFWIANILSLLLIFGAITWLPALMIKAGYGINNALVFLAVFQVGALAASILGSLMADRHEPKTVVLASFGCAVVGLVALAAKPPAALVYLLVILMGAGATGAQNLLLAYIASFYPARSRGSGLGLAVALGRLGGIAGPLIGGVLLAGGATAEQNFLVFAAAPLIAFAVLAFGPRIRVR